MIATPKGNRAARLKTLHSLLDMLESDQQFLPAKTLSRLHRDGMGFHHNNPVTAAIPKLYATMLVGALIRSLHGKRPVPQSIKRARALGISVFPSEAAPERERKRLPKVSRAQQARLKLARLRAGRDDYDVLC